MIVNINARVLTDETVFVGYNEDGKAKDRSFPSWVEFCEWLLIACRSEE